MKDGRRRRSVTIPAGIEGKCHRIGKSYQLQKALNMTDYDRYLRFQSQLLRPLLGPSEGEEWGASEEDSKKTTTMMLMVLALQLRLPPSISANLFLDGSQR